MERESSLPVIPAPRSAPSNCKSVCRQNPPRCREDRKPFVRDVSPLVSRKQQEERVNRICSRPPLRSATVPMRKKDVRPVGTRSPQGGKKLEPLNHTSVAKSREETDAKKCGIGQVGYRLRKGSKLPAIQLSCPSIIVTDTDSMVRSRRSTLLICRRPDCL